MTEYIEIMAYLHQETSDAILISETGDDEKVIWLPKSQLDNLQITPISENLIPMVDYFATVTFEAPEWLAKDKGLI